jgi:hypothetical protein
MNMQVNWPEHYKAVRARITSAPRRVSVAPPVAERLPRQDRLPEVPTSILVPEKLRTKTRLYPVPVGPFMPRDWLLVASTSKDREERQLLPKISLRQIIAIVCKVYRIRVECLTGARRTADVIRPRQEAMWLCKKYTLHSLPEIGRFFGGRDHTTVLHAVRKIDALIGENSYQSKAEPFVQDYILYLYKEPARAAAACREG